jgi:O-antigen ligase
LAYLGLLLYTAILFIRPQEWVPGFKGFNVFGFGILDFVIGFSLIAWLLHLATSDWKLSDAPQNWLMLGLFFAILMSHVRHTYLAAVTANFQDFGKVVLIYFLIASCVDSVPRVKTLILVMVAGCVLMSIHGIMQVETGAGFGGAPPMFRQELIRPRGFGIFHDPNDLALILVTATPFLLSVIHGRDYATPLKAASAAALIPVIYCIYLTNSRGGWLALGVMFTVYTYLHLRNKKIGIVIALAAFASVVTLGPSRIHTASLDDSSSKGRLAAWGQGNRMLKQWPLFGAGKGRFNEFAAEGRSAHNSFVLCWAEIGLFGYFFYMGLILATLKDARAFARAGPEKGEARDMASLSKAGMAALLGYLSAAFFLTRTWQHPPYILFALFAAMHSMWERKNGKLESGFALGDGKYVLVAEVASIPAFWMLVRLMN